MSKLSTLFRLSAMRHRAGANWIVSVAWATGLLWRNHQTNQRNKGRAEFDRTIHHQL